MAWVKKLNQSNSDNFYCSQGKIGLTGNVLKLNKLSIIKEQEVICRSIGHRNKVKFV